MPLSNDQRALLRLLAQREQGYEDIGALMGLTVEQVRERVREALDELDRDELEATAAPEPPRQPAPPPVAQPSRPEPIPQPRAAPRRRPSRSAPRLRLPGDRRRRFELAGGLLIVALIVLFATGAIDIGGGGGGGSPSHGARPASARGPATESQQLTQAVLQPVGGEGEASGRAVFGRVGKEVVLEVVAKGLAPSPPGQSYTVWLYRSPKLVLRVGAVRVGKAGRLAVRFPLPAELLAYVAAGAFRQIDVSLTSDAAYRREVTQAKREKQLPRYTGSDVLRGEITGPIVRK